MALSNLFGWNNNESTGSACGAGDKPAACGAGDKPAACGAGDKPEEKPAACGSACGAGDKQ
ncbi:MAG: ACGX-repeat peptide [Butyrivibrio sp.]|nr:ACGX-repeat peptide [Butyrivibrio sp.]MBR1642285.1 ACGX-repeat peptide [Butyrivibrio sp.]